MLKVLSVSRNWNSGEVEVETVSIPIEKETSKTYKVQDDIETKDIRYSWGSLSVIPKSSLGVVQVRMGRAYIIYKEDDVVLAHSKMREHLVIRVSESMAKLEIDKYVLQEFLKQQILE